LPNIQRKRALLPIKSQSPRSLPRHGHRAGERSAKSGKKELSLAKGIRALLRPPANINFAASIYELYNTRSQQTQSRILRKNNRFLNIMTKPNLESRPHDRENGRSPFCVVGAEKMNKDELIGHIRRKIQRIYKKPPNHQQVLD